MEVVLFFAGIVFLSWFNKVLQKLVANQFEIRSFFIYQYAFATIFALLLFIYFHRQDKLIQFSKKSFLAGSALGSCGFLGSYALMTALTKGPLTLITSLHSLYILVTALVAWIVFNEELNAKKLLLLGAAVVAVILLKVG